MDSRSGSKRRQHPSNAKGKQRAGQGIGQSDAGLAGKLHHASLQTIRAAKKARTFEVQKLVRKIKQDAAKTAGPSMKASPEDLQAVLDALKACNIDQIAAYALRTRLGKDHALRDHPEVQTYLQAPNDLHIDPQSTSGKAINRILASKVLVEALNLNIDGLRLRAGIQNQANGKGKTKKETDRKLEKGKAETSATKRATQTSQSAIERRSTHKATSSGDETSDDSDEDVEGEDDDATVSHISSEDEDVGEDEFTGFAAASDDEDAISVASDTSFPLSKPESRKEIKVPASKKRKASPVRERPTTSAFLPSLAAGYTLGDSDGSVYSDEDGAGSALPQRKNRRGQQARRLIAERKYGKNAKHLKQQQEREKETEVNRAKARAEREIERNQRSGRYGTGADSNLTGVLPGRSQREWAKESEPVEPTKKFQQSKKVHDTHPSWEAKKKTKEAQALSAMPPAGKKIRFD